MADYNSSLPVRTQNNGDVVAKIADGTTPTQLLNVDSSGKITAKMDDGAGNPLASSTSAPTGTEQALIVRNIPSGTQTISGTVTANQGTSPWVENVSQFGGNNVVTGTGASGLGIPRVTVANDSNILATQSGTWTVQQGSTPTSIANAWPVLPTDGTNSQSYTAAGEAKVSVTQPLPAGTNLIGGTNVYVGGTIASASNPVPVTVTTTAPGTPIQSFQTSSALAAGSSVTLTYTVPALHSFSLQRVFVSSEARISAQIQYGAAISTPQFYMLFNSSANPNVDVPIVAAPTLTAGQVVNVVITNNDVAASNVYATIEGNQIS